MSLFDLALIVVLLQHHRRLGYPYLRLGGLALGFEMASQVLVYLGVFLTSDVAYVVAAGIAQMLFSLAVLGAVMTMRGRVTPWPLPGVWLLVFFVIAGVVMNRAIAGDFDVASDLFARSPWLAAFGLAMLIVLFDMRERRSPGRAWLAGAIAFYLCLEIWAPFVYADSALFAQLSLVNAVLAIFAGLGIVLVASEEVSEDLRDERDRVEESQRENRRLELHVTQAQRTQSLGDMAAGIAHDFNNLLTSILGFTSVAMRKLPANSEVRKDLYMVMSGARQAVDLTSQMLQYAGKGPTDFENIDVSAVVAGNDALLRSMVPGTVTLREQLLPELPTVRGDRVELGQVVVNLVSNAVNAVNDDGTIVISTGWVEVDEALLAASHFAELCEPGEYVLLSVQDNGRGIPQRQLDRIFDPFYSDGERGRGMGLAKIAGIVRLHGGFVHVDSTQGVGTTMGVYLPQVVYQVHRGRGSSPRGRVLFADDDARIRGLLSSILQAERFELAVAADGVEAAERFRDRNAPFDLAIIDCTMPGLSGAEVYGRIRAQDPRLPVILISGYDQNRVMAEVSEDGFARFLKKPFSVDELLDVVAVLLQPGAEGAQDTPQAQDSRSPTGRTPGVMSDDD